MSEETTFRPPGTRYALGYIRQRAVRMRVAKDPAAWHPLPVLFVYQDNELGFALTGPLIMSQQLLVIEWACRQQTTGPFVHSARSCNKVPWIALFYSNQYNLLMASTSCFHGQRQDELSDLPTSSTKITVNVCIAVVLFSALAVGGFRVNHVGRQFRIGAP